MSFLLGQKGIVFDEDGYFINFLCCNCEEIKLNTGNQGFCLKTSH